MKKTKILVTLGPASVNKIPRLIEAGMDACRINASHNSPEEFEDKIKKIRNVKDIPIVLDTQGPEIRLVIKSDILASCRNT